MKPLGLMTGLRFDWPVFDVLELFEESGVTHAEIWGHPDHADLTDSQTIRRLADYQWNHEIDFVAVHPPGSREWDLSSPDKDRRSQAVERIKVIVNHLSEMGVNRVVLHPGGRRPEVPQKRTEALKRSAESLNQLLDYIKNRPQKICLENTLPHHLGGRLKELRKIDELTDREFHMTLDLSHARLSPDPIGSYIDEFGYRIIHTHISDNNGEHDDHYPPGMGSIDLPAVLSKLSRDAFLDYWNMEVLNSPDKEDPSEVIRQALSGMRECLSEVSPRKSRS
jgi:sugar phosphate isomerase/epimerase